MHPIISLCNDEFIFLSSCLVCIIQLFFSFGFLYRLDDAIEILEHVVGMREEKLGTANPDVDDEKKRLAELLKDAGRVRSRKAISLENLLDANPHTVNKDGIKV